MNDNTIFDDLDKTPTQDELENLAQACIRMMLYVAYHYRVVNVAIPRWLIEIGFPSHVSHNETVH
jgi:hypothetical protein